MTTIFAESLETIRRDIVTVRPTIVTGVPRVYEKIQANILAGGAALGEPRRTLFGWGVRVGLARARKASRSQRVGPLLFARNPRSRIDSYSRRSVTRSADVCALLVSGSAPLPASVGEFFSAIGLPVIEGYGLTETAPVLTVNPQDAPRLGTVGKAIPGVELRIADDGEILARGPNVMSGYHNKPEATAEVLRDGWFHTGDIGTLDADGYLTITDRKKDLLVTSGGKKIAPQPIEARAQAQPARGGSGRARRPAQVRRRADRSRLRRARAPPSRSGPSAGPSSASGRPRAWSRGRRARQPRPQRRRGRAVRRDRGRPQPRALAVRANQEDQAPAARILDGLGRADARR